MAYQFAGPKGGRKLTGPIAPDSSIIHPCYTDFILANIAKSEYLGRSNVPTDQQLTLWRQEYPHNCRSSCPGASAQSTPALHEQDIESDDDFTPPATIITVGQQNRRHSLRLATTGTSAGPISAETPSTILSPLDLGVDSDSHGPLAAPFFNNPSHSLPPSPTLSDTPQSPVPGFVLPTTPDTLEFTLYQAPIAPTYNNFMEFENFVANCCQTVGNIFRVRAENVPNAAKGLLEAIKSVSRSHVATFVDSRDSVISPAGLSLSQIFSCPSWVFFAYVYFYTFIIGSLICSSFHKQRPGE